MTTDATSANEPDAANEGRSGLRDELIRTALHMVNTEGVDAISVREVARRAGVSSGAPFRHFKDRNALLAALAEDGFLRLEASLGASLGSLGTDPVERLKAIGVTHAIFAARHPAHFRVMHHPALSLESYPRIAEIAQRQKSNLRALVVQGQEQGLLRNADPDLVVLTCVSVVGGLARLFVDGGLECPVDLATQPFAEVDALARAVVELVGIGIVDPERREDYEKSVPSAVRGRKRRRKATVRLGKRPARSPTERR